MRITALLTALAAILLLFGCAKQEIDAANINAADVFPKETAAQQTQIADEKADQVMQSTVKIKIEEAEFTVILEENETVALLLNELPAQFSMRELNGNEKYCYLPLSLPTEPYSPNEIHAGDVMLYQDNCLVVFYESFQTTYRYTKIGVIEDASGLEEAVGSGDVQMQFTVE